METVEYCICDKCKKVITDESDGFIIHGALLSANPKKLNLIVGSMENINLIAKYAVCKNCLGIPLAKTSHIR